MGLICVVGSINMDLVTRTNRFPSPGETVTGLSFNTFPGGKGANQAVALARLGAQVSYIGRLGKDLFGDQYLTVFKSVGIDIEGVEQDDKDATGTASIEVDASGENHIIIVAGANARVSPSYLESKLSILEKASFLLLQLEIPMDTVIAAASFARSKGLKVILDPAPAQQIPEELFSYVDFITPNETETEILTGIPVHDRESARRGAEVFLKRGIGTVVIKAGKRGAYVSEGGDLRLAAGFPVKAIDTTAAGDSFNAGFAFALSEGKGPWEAAAFANAVGALSTTKIGAQTAMPCLEEVRKFLAR